jgi:hypothetical protein
VLDGSFLIRISYEIKEGRIDELLVEDADIRSVQPPNKNLVLITRSEEDLVACIEGGTEDGVRIGTEE